MTELKFGIRKIGQLREVVNLGGFAVRSVSTFLREMLNLISCLMYSERM